MCLHTPIYGNASLKFNFILRILENREKLVGLRAIRRHEDVEWKFLLIVMERVSTFIRKTQFGTVKTFDILKKQANGCLILGSMKHGMKSWIFFGRERERVKKGARQAGRALK